MVNIISKLFASNGGYSTDESISFNGRRAIKELNGLYPRAKKMEKPVLVSNSNESEVQIVTKTIERTDAASTISEAKRTQKCSDKTINDKKVFMFESIENQINSAILSSLQSKRDNGELKFRSAEEFLNVYNAKVKQYQYICYSEGNGYHEIKYNLEFLMSDNAYKLNDDRRGYILDFFERLMSEYPTCLSQNFYLELLTEFAKFKWMSHKIRVIKLGNRIFLDATDLAIQDSWKKIKKDVEEEIKKLSEEKTQVDIDHTIRVEKKAALTQKATAEPGNNYKPN